MRRKHFTVGERTVLIPIELVASLKGGFLLFVLFFLIGLFGGQEGFWTRARGSCVYSAQISAIGVLAGAVFTPLLLPWLPGRAFSAKGAALGVLGSLLFTMLRWGEWGTAAGKLGMVAGFLIIVAASAFLAMNFTGASTFTSLSGVKKEMRWAVPLEIGAAVIGFGFWVASRVIA
jgi:acetyl-CoA decarbonylase/synthase complex subunit gamma